MFYEYQWVTIQTVTQMDPHERWRVVPGIYNVGRETLLMERKVEAPPVSLHPPVPDD